MQLKRSGPAPSQQADGRANLFCPPPSTSRPRVATCAAQRVEVSMTCSVPTFRSRFGAAGRRCCRPRRVRADKPKEIRIDWATYNPVSMVLKDKGLLEKEFAKDGIAVRWVKTARLQRAAIPQRRLDRLRLDRGLGGAGRQDQRQPDQVDLHLFAAGMDRAGHHQGLQDHQGRGPQGQEGRDGARHRSAHLPGARAAQRPA